MSTWQAFVLEHGWHARKDHLAVVLEQPAYAIERVRRQAACRRLPKRLGFVELFALWRGRPPAEDEWPAPRRRTNGAYEWLAPEYAVLAQLVGTVDLRAIAATLTTRLRRITGDQSATRGRTCVQVAINRIGLQTSDVAGGLTTTDAARRVGRLSLITSAIAAGQLRTFRVGIRHVIPRGEFERWLETRQEPPDGYVRLASLRAPLGMSSDSKLPEYAALGHIPTAVLVAGAGIGRGVWYLAADVARKILADAKAGRKLPWHGKPLSGNQQAMWRKWQQRKHARCQRCTAIWGGRAPVTFEEFCARYVDLTLGKKRHLTVDRTKSRGGSTGWRTRGSVAHRMRSAGITVKEAAQQLQQPSKWIRGLLRTGLFEPHGVARDPLGGEAVRITPVGLAMLRGIADGEASTRDDREWVGVHVAAQITGVCLTTVHRWRMNGELRTRRGNRGIEFEQSRLRVRAAAYWQWAIRRYRRAAPPAWFRATEAA